MQQSYLRHTLLAILETFCTNRFVFPGNSRYAQENVFFNLS